MKRKSPVFVKILACLLLLGSLASFLLPWMKLAADVGVDQERMSPGELIQNFAGMNAEAVKEAARTGFAVSGAQMDAATLDDLLDRTLDGRFRFHELGILCGDLGCLCRAVGEPEAGHSLDLAKIIVWAAAGLMALLGFVALICQLTDHRGGIVPYFLLGALITAGLLLLRQALNSYLVEQSESLLDELGIGSLAKLFSIDVRIVKMGIGAYLCPFLALLAFLFMGIKKKQPKLRYETTPYPARRSAPPQAAAGSQPGGNASPAAARPAGWTCPNCGRSCPGGEAFCTNCGTKKPAPLRCPACGRQGRPGESYCTSCGTRLR